MLSLGAPRPNRAGQSRLRSSRRDQSFWDKCEGIRRIVRRVRPAAIVRVLCGYQVRNGTNGCDLPAENLGSHLDSFGRFRLEWGDAFVS